MSYPMFPVASATYYDLHTWEVRFVCAHCGSEQIHFLPAGFPHGVWSFRPGYPRGIGGHANAGFVKIGYYCECDSCLRTNKVITSRRHESDPQEPIELGRGPCATDRQHQLYVEWHYGGDVP